MKNSITYLMLLLGVFYASTLSAQWTKTNGLPGGDFRYFAQIGDTTFALHGAGIYCSTNGGLSWQNLLTYKWYWSAGMVSDGHSLLVKRYNVDPLKRLLRSDDAGQTWKPVPVPDSLTFSDIIVIGKWILIGSSDGVFRTGNDGATWEFVGHVGNLRLEGQRIYGNDAAWLLASDDFGQTWKPLTAVTKVTDILVEDSIAIVFHYDPSKITISKNYGQTWEAYLPTLPSHIRFDQMYNMVWHDGNVYGFNADVWKTADLGKTWTQAAGPNLYVAYNGIGVGDGLLVSGTANGVFRSTDGGDTWSAVNEGLAAQTPPRLRSYGGHLFAPGREGIYRLAADGENWELQEVGIPQSWSLMTYSDYLEIGNNSVLTFGNKPWVSNNSGANWEEAAGNDNSFAYITRLEVAAGKVIGWSDSGSWDSYFVSSDNGQTFQKMTSLANQQNVDIGFLDIDKGVLYALAHDHRLFQSIDGSKSWAPIGTPAPLNLFGQFWPLDGQFFVRGNTVFLFNTSTDSQFGFKVLFSNDLGQTWQLFDKIATGLPWGSGIFNDLVKTNGYLIAATSEGIIYSSDAGLTWTDWNEGFTNPVASRLCVHDGYLWAAMNSDGVWKRSLAELPPVAVGQPETTGSLAIFPNPTCEQFTVQTNDENGWLTVRDLFGRIVVARKIGGQNATISCQNWPAGIYNISFDSEGKRAVGRVLVQK